MLICSWLQLFFGNYELPKAVIEIVFGLCNLYLHELDKKLGKANIPFVRFADDFLLFCPTQQAAIQALAYTKKQLDNLGLNLHPKKTRVVRSHPKLTFLGKNLPAPSR